MIDCFSDYVCLIASVIMCVWLYDLYGFQVVCMSWGLHQLIMSIQLAVCMHENVIWNDYNVSDNIIMSKYLVWFCQICVNILCVYHAYYSTDLLLRFINHEMNVWT
jgi:hypothetical protein